ncbi:MAG: DHHA1 domain-containing protein [Bacteroides sp.]|nr:DHHA1 domain-containing protein [Bacteroides sp.]MCM1550653.1 DHHA1 domain-containing protein [Clostridium sp.]
MDWKKLIELLKGHKVYIQTHNYPDPDAIASGLGLQVFLRHHGVESTMCYDGTIEKLNTRRMMEVFDFEIYNIEDIPDMKPEDYIVTVDAQKFNANITDFIGDEVACIDHHPTYVECDYKYKDIRLVGACATLIAEYFKVSGTPMDSNTATALLFGIQIDTNNLTRGVTPLDIDIFAYLYEYVDADKLSSMSNCAMELKDLRAYGAAIQNIRIYENIGFAEIPFDCPDGLIAMVSDFILDLDVVDFAIVYAYREDGLKFSVRSNLSTLNAGQIVAEAMAGIGSGGGHASMAGGFVPAENIEKLGHMYDDEIEKRFVTVCREKGK